MSFFSEEHAGEMRALFFESATELLQAMNEEGLELERRPGDEEAVRAVRRTVHTLKGDSAACGFQELSSLAHELEDALTPELAKIHGGRLAEVILAAADTFTHILAAYRGKKKKVPKGDSVRTAIRRLAEAKVDAVDAAPVTSETSQGPFQWTEYEQLAIEDALKRGLKVMRVTMTIDKACAIRGAAVQLAKTTLEDLGKILVQRPADGEAQSKKLEHIEAALATSYDEAHIAKKCKIPAVISAVEIKRLELPHPVAVPEPQSKALEVDHGHAATQDSILRVDAERIDTVLNLVGELVIGKSMLTQTMSEFDKRFSKDPLRSKFADALAFQARVLNDLQKSVMKIRMVPVEQLFRRFPRIIRDVAKACEKDVNLELRGQETDLDKSVLDQLSEPLSHLIRNAIGHGIETPAERTAAGKPAQGTVTLNAYHLGNEVVIEVGDDGAGIDKDRVVAKAIERGLVTKEQAAGYTNGEALELIFQSGFSTADSVTEISGRGVGMDVVKSVLDRLKGSVSIDSRPGEGTRFLLKVPLTLAIIKALMFQAGEKLYAIPLTSVVEITRANENEVHTVDRRECIRLREEVLPLIRLRKLARVGGDGRTKLFIIVVAVGDRKYGLVVDRLVGEEELVIKALDDHLVATEFVSGASILGDGAVVLILNIQAIVNRLGRAQALEASA